MLSHAQLFAIPWTATLQVSCLPLFLRVSSKSCPLSQWCFPAISSSAALFSFHLQSFPASGGFPMSRLFASHSPSIGASASASVLPINIQGLFPLGLTGLIFSGSKGLSRVFSSTTIQKHHFYGSQPFLHPILTSIHDYWKRKKKTLSLIIWIFAGKVICLLFNTLSRFVIAFFLRSKCLLISLLQSSSAGSHHGRSHPWQGHVEENC